MRGRWEGLGGGGGDRLVLSMPKLEDEWDTDSACWWRSPSPRICIGAVAAGTKRRHPSLHTLTHSRDHLVDARRPVFMYCTGGIRCEKASVFLRQELGVKHVFQLQGRCVCVRVVFCVCACARVRTARITTPCVMDAQAARWLLPVCTLFVLLPVASHRRHPDRLLSRVVWRERTRVL